MAAAHVSDGRAPSIERSPWTIGMMPLAAVSGHTSAWSCKTNVHVNAKSTAAVASEFRTIGTKAYGTRRLGEHAST